MCQIGIYYGRYVGNHLFGLLHAAGRIGDKHGDGIAAAVGQKDVAGVVDGNDAAVGVDIARAGFVGYACGGRCKRGGETIEAGVARQHQRADGFMNGAEVEHVPAVEAVEEPRHFNCGGSVGVAEAEVAVHLVFGRADGYGAVAGCAHQAVDSLRASNHVEQGVAGVVVAELESVGEQFGEGQAQGGHAITVAHGAPGVFFYQRRADGNGVGDAGGGGETAVGHGEGLGELVDAEHRQRHVAVYCNGVAAVDNDGDADAGVFVGDIFLKLAVHGAKAVGGRTGRERRGAEPHQYRSGNASH